MAEKNREPSIADRKPPDFKRYDGLRVEGLNRDGRVRLRAELSIPSVEEAEMIWISGARPEKPGPFRVLLRGEDPDDEQEIYIRGVIRRIDGDYWELNNMRLEQTERRFYRVKTDFDADAVILNRHRIRTNCRVVNLSEGGVSIETDVKYWIEDRLELTSETFESVGLSSLVCEILRGWETHIPGIYGYGCEFLGLNDAQRQRLYRLVMNQRWQNPPE